MKTMIRNARVLMHAQRCVKEEAVLIEDGTILDIASECELPHADQEKQLLEQSLKMAKYNQKRAAELLGLTYHQLRALLKKHQMR
mgnify:CR=1 FL=1